SGVDFSGCRMTMCNFSDAELVDVDFSGAQMRNTLFVGATIQKTRFVGATLPQSLWNNVLATDSSFAGAELSMSVFNRGSFQRCNFTGCDLQFADFSYAGLLDCRLDDVALNRTRFHRAVLDSEDIKRRPGAVERDDELFEAELRSAGFLKEFDMPFWGCMGSGRSIGLGPYVTGVSKNDMLSCMKLPTTNVFIQRKPAHNIFSVAPLTIDLPTGVLGLAS